MSEIAFPFVFFSLLILICGCSSILVACGRMLLLPAFTPAQIGFGWSRNGKLAGGRNSVTPCSLLFLSHLGIDEGGAQWRYSRRISPRLGNWGLLLYPARLGEIWQPKCFIWENMLRTNKFTRLSSLVQDMTWHSPSFLWHFPQSYFVETFQIPTW